MYMDFFEDYIADAKLEMYRYFVEAAIAFDEAEDSSMEGKPGVYKINYYMRDHLQTPFITKVLAKSKSRDTIIENVGRFIDTHSSQLGTSGPVYSFKFDEPEVKFLYDLFAITGDQIIKIFNDMVQETYYGKIAKFIDGWVKNSPHKVLITAVLIDALQNGYEDIVTCCEYMWAFSEYPLIYHHFWKTGVKEDVMDYTIEHLGSKYKVKKVNNLRGLLKYDAHSSVEFMSDRLKAGVDHAYADLMNRMRSQINNTFRNIANAYYDNDKNNATQHNRSSQFDDGTLADQEGFTTNVAQVVDRTVSKFTSGGINASIVRVVADASSVDKDNLSGYINQIMSSKDNKIAKILENIITAYFVKFPTSAGVNTNEFINFGLSLYRSISTSKDPMYQEIRGILDHWMFNIIDIKQYYQREGTIINYTRAIFNYLIFMINHYN